MERRKKARESIFLGICTAPKVGGARERGRGNALWPEFGRYGRGRISQYGRVTEGNSSLGGGQKLGFSPVSEGGCAGKSPLASRREPGPWVPPDSPRGHQILEVKASPCCVLRMPLRFLTSPTFGRIGLLRGRTKSSGLQRYLIQSAV